MQLPYHHPRGWNLEEVTPIPSSLEPRYQGLEVAPQMSIAPVCLQVHSGGGVGEKRGEEHERWVTAPPLAPQEGDARVGVLYDQSMEAHKSTGDHPERPQRIMEVFKILEEEGLLARCWRLPARKATDDELLLCHTKEHVEKVESYYALGAAATGDLESKPDYVNLGDSLYACAETAEAARFAAGCCVEAAKRVASGEVAAALAVVRPPGHHAECARAQGFCFYNNVAVAARAVIADSGGIVKKVLVLDWDVHHGNGIQEVLFQDPNIIYISIHRDPKNFYPFTAGFIGEVGEGPGQGFNINIPWPRKGAGDADYLAALDLIVEPVAQAFAADLVIIAAGFDAARGDPLGGCMVTPEGYAEMTRRMMGLGRQGGGSPSPRKLVLALEGGYSNGITATCVAACVKALLVPQPSLVPSSSPSENKGREEEGAVEDLFASENKGPLGTTGPLLEEVVKVQFPYWTVLGDMRWEEYLKNLKEEGKA